MLEALAQLQATSARAEQLLLEAYSRIREPDSIYAVTMNRHSSSLLPLLEHEGAWSRALLGYDLLQQAGEKLPSQNGIVNALKQLGCQSTLRTYLRAIDPGPAEGNVANSTIKAESWLSRKARRHFRRQMHFKLASASILRGPSPSLSPTACCCWVLCRIAKMSFTPLCLNKVFLAHCSWSGRETVLDWIGAKEEAAWLKEAQCEAAWQMGRWQEASEPPAQQAQARDCFHAIICSSVKVCLPFTAMHIYLFLTKFLLTWRKTTNRQGHCEYAETKQRWLRQRLYLLFTSMRWSKKKDFLLCF